MVEQLVGIKLTHATAGFLGGLTAYLINPRMHWRDGAALMIIGGVSSYYLVPALSEHLSLSIETASFIGYAIGLIAQGFIIRAKERIVTKLLDKAESKVNVLLP